MTVCNIEVIFWKVVMFETCRPTSQWSAKLYIHLLSKPYIWSIWRTHGVMNSYLNCFILRIILNFNLQLTWMVKVWKLLNKICWSSVPLRLHFWLNRLTASLNLLFAAWLRWEAEGIEICVSSLRDVTCQKEHALSARQSPVLKLITIKRTNGTAMETTLAFVTSCCMQVCGFLTLKTFLYK